jgi:predicted phosphodiesterase
MRALVISDIHSNLPALEAVLAAAPQHDAVWNLGDVVGYCANPNEVVDLTRKLDGVVVRGNHDRACSGTMEYYQYRNLSWLASYAADWTQQVLTKENQQWLSKLRRGPIRPLGPRVLCVHGMPKNEDEYLGEEAGARRSLRASRAWITFFGHTHVQEGWCAMRGDLTLVKPTFPSRHGPVRFEVALRQDRRYLINPGSVGQPRDGDWRAAFAVYDDNQATLTWYRVPYKVLTAQRRILRAELPEVLATRLPCQADPHLMSRIGD